MEAKSQQKCPDQETLAAWAEGLSSSQERALVLSHLDHCDRCREIAGGIMAFLDEEDTGAKPGASAASALPGRGFWIGGLAAAALLMFFLVPWPTEDRSSIVAAQVVETLLRLEENGYDLTRHHLFLPQAPKGVSAVRTGEQVIPQNMLDAAFQALDTGNGHPDLTAWYISLHLLAGHHAEATALARQAVAGSTNPDLLSLEALARYRHAESKNDRSTAEQALDDLNKLHLAHPDHKPTIYNLGVIYWESRQTSQAREIWNRYLELEPVGPYAARIEFLLEQ